MQNQPIASAAFKISHYVERLAAYPCIAATAGMTIVVLLGVFCRYLLRVPLSWSEEIARYLMIWAASLAISIAIMRREHLGITFVITRMPPSVQKIMIILSHILVLWFLWIFTKYGYTMALEGRAQLSPALSRYGVTMIWSLSAIPVAGALALVQTFLQMLIDIFGGEEGPDVKEMVDF